jgi:hypothetical protein
VGYNNMFDHPHVAEEEFERFGKRPFVSTFNLRNEIKKTIKFEMVQFYFYWLSTKIL